MKSQVQNKIITVIGHKGYGKTVLTEALAELNRRPVIFADPRFQYNTDPKRRWSFRSVAEFRKWIMQTTNFRLFYDYNLQCVVNAFDDTFEELAALVYKMRGLTFVIDEIDMFFTPRTSNTASIYKLIHYGRHQEIDIITSSRRPANISRNLTSQTDYFYFSRLREPIDKKYIKDAVGAEYVPIVESLEKFSFLRLDPDFTPKIITTSPRDLELLELN